MKNIYDGLAVLDAAGEAWVTLPDYFDALNKDFRYQLTAVGGPGPGLMSPRNSRATGSRLRAAPPARKCRGR